MIDIVFWFLAVTIVFSAAATVFSKNIIYSAFSLILTFVGVAGLYVLLSADFLAVTQIMVYVGGILLLLLFGVMLTNRITMMSLKTDVNNVWPSLVISGSVLTALLYIIWVVGDWATGDIHWDSSVEKIGALAITQYVLPMELVAIVLLIAVIGASYIARKDKERLQP